MSPRRSKATSWPSGLTSTLIQVPSSTSRVKEEEGPGGLSTSHFFSSFLSLSSPFFLSSFFPPLESFLASLESFPSTAPAEPAARGRGAWESEKTEEERRNRRAV